MSCPINTDLANAAAFVALSSRDQLICLAQLLSSVNLGGVQTPSWEFSALSERDQWLSIAILLEDGGGGVGADPSTLLAAATDVQGADTPSVVAAISQRFCDLQ
jgi:hypothetical protein